MLDPAPIVSVAGFADMLNSEALIPVIVGLEIVKESDPVLRIVKVRVTVARFISAGPKSVPSETEVTVSPLAIERPSP